MVMKKTKILRTAVSGVLIVVMLAAAIVANVMIPANMNVINGALGDDTRVEIKYPESYPDDLDLEYNKADYDEETIKEAERELNEQVVGEGIVLLKNENDAMPYDKGTKFSFFGCNSVDIRNGNSSRMNPDKGAGIKEAFEDRGFKVNETLWNFYESGNGAEYGLGPGSVNYGEGEDFSINECPIDVIQKESGLVDSFAGTVPVFVWNRKVGEGRDMPRSMYNHTDVAEDKVKNYVEPDSVELGVLKYLNDNFDDVVLLISSSAAMELGWVEQFEHIHSILCVSTAGNYGMYSLADIFSGDVNPSGRTVDTFAYDAMSAPAAANYGDFQYFDEDGAATGYNYVSYKEGIYVGYRYYETRYEDVVLGQGNAGDYDYDSTVKYPFGYGLSYTTFEWENFKTEWKDDVCTVTVDVTNTGGMAGKDVVEIYAQSPYTEYDKENKVEKTSVALVGFGKTSILEPGQTETVEVTFEKEQLKSYDYVNAKTYILDAGDYYITAGKNAHDALNNILAHKGKTTKDGMTEDGDAGLAAVYTPENADTDTETYAKNASTDAEVTNQFDFANGELQYLSRNDWEGTWPSTDGEVSDIVSTWGNEINGTDASGAATAYTYRKTISAEDLEKIKSTDSLSPVKADSLTDEPVYDADNGVQLIALRGKAFDDPLWDDLLDNLSAEEYRKIISFSAYGTIELESVGKPACSDMDSASGISAGGTGMTYSGPMVLAQTWNADLAFRYGEMIGNDALIGGLKGWYAPAMNIHRLPFSGRNNEYYSEDGFLSGVMAAGTSRGATNKGLYTFIKHFALNDQENLRGDQGMTGLCTWSNEQAIREIYLKPFEMCIMNDPVTIQYVKGDGNGGYENATAEIPPVLALMSAFNRLGYTWTGGCYPLLTGVLRNEWGFNGFVITDSAYSSGVDMNAYQMIEAGGDAKLMRDDEKGYWEFKKDDPAYYHYSRNAVHHILYAVVNSKTMNGLIPGSEYVTPLTIAEKVLIGVDVAAAVVILALGYFIYRGFRPRKKKE